MSGTFSSFGSALSALRYNRVAMDVASNNISNAYTEGYTRRTAQAQATGAPAVQALWSTWDGYGGGVEVGGVERMVDPLLDRRSRLEHATLSALETRSAALTRFETTIGEPSDNGVAAALSSFKQGWQDVANNPADEAARSQLLGRANTLVEAIGAQYTAASSEWADQYTTMQATLVEANKLTEDLANLNGALLSAHTSGDDANLLLDQRDQLTMRLAELTGAKVKIESDTTATVTLGGEELVDGTTAQKLLLNDADTMAEAKTPGVMLWVVPLDYDTSPTTPGGPPNFPAPTESIGWADVSGEIRGRYEVLTGDLPDYVEKLNTFATELKRQVNEIHSKSYNLQPTTADPADQLPQTGLDFFSGDGAADLAVAINNVRDVAVAAAPDTYDASKGLAIAALDMGGKIYRSLVTTFGVEVASVRRVAANQGVLTSQIDANRESLSGVSIDEEMVNLLAAQRAYEGASRVITTLDSVLDTLINRTGLTR